MKKRMATFLMITGGLLTFWALVAGYNVMTGPHTDLGIVNGELSPVPESPNAVSTFATDEEHSISPLEFDGAAQQAISEVAEVVKAMPRARIVEQTANYLRAEYQSKIFRFVDDVEFLIQENSNVIHFRSASRLGHSDLGANRARMEEFKQKFQAKQQQTPTK